MILLKLKIKNLIRYFENNFVGLA